MGDAVSPKGNGRTRDDAHIRTFLIADVRGYTVFTQAHGDEAAARLATKFATVAREGVEARGGVVVELRGDEALAVFDSARQAIRASVELQRRFVEATVTDPSLPLAVGIGLDAGEAVPVDGGFRGGALNLAARLCSIAGPAEILASPAVTHLARKVDGVTYVDRGAVRLKGLDQPVQVLRLRAEAEDAADDLAFRRALGSSGVRLAPTVPDGVVPNPYKGLRAFEETDAADFFGREELIEQLVERLGTTRFLAVVGPSGSGKSSVVRAGLIPSLRRGAIPGSEGWPIADMFPGPHPLDGLEAALLRSAPDPPASLIEQLAHDERGLHRAVLRLLPSDGSELVLVIDQFEEVFTLVEDEAVRAHFLGSLEAVASDPHSRLRIVATLRADFYDRPLLYRGFAELFKSRVEAVIPLSAEELERAISGPAKRVDVSLEPGLVAAMLADVAEEPGALPLMEYALTELFERRDGRVLSLDAYREIGGVSGALGRRAEELFAELDDDGKEAAHQLFLRLVALGEGTEDTRRRVFRSEVSSLDVNQQAMAAVIDPFGASRQLSFDRDAKTGHPTIELAHEAMLTAWSRLHRWIDDAREDLRLERRLSAAAGDWIEAGKDPSFLLAGARLDQIETWRAASTLALTPDEREFLDASLAERERHRADEEARAARERDLERRSVRRLRAVVAVLAVAALVAGGLTVFALGQSSRAEQEEQRAEARELAAASVANLDADPELSILLALEAIQRTRSADGSVLPEAEAALHRAVIASRIVNTVPDLGGALDWSPEGVFVTEGPEDSGMIDIRDATTGEPALPAFRGHDVDVNDVQFSPDGSMLATGGDDGALRFWDPENGSLLFEVAGEGGVFGPSFDGDGSLVAASWVEEGRIRIVDATTGDVVRTIRPGAPGAEFVPFDTSLSPDGRRVVVSNLGGTNPAVFDVASGDRVFDLVGHTYGVQWVAWSLDGRRIATAGDDASARVWDAETGRLEAELLGHAAGVITVDWALDSRRLVTAAFDGTAKVWAIDEGGAHELMTLVAQETRSGTLAAFSPDGRRVLTGDIGIRAVKVWDVSLSGDAELTNVETDELAPVDVVFLPDGRFLSSADRGSVALWDTATGRSVRTIGPGGGSLAPVGGIAANRDGTRIATLRNFSPVADVWNMETGDRLFQVEVAGGELGGIDLAGNDRLLAWASFGGTTTMFDERGEEIRSFEEQEEFIVDVAAISDDGRWVATSGGMEQRPLSPHVTVWDAASGRPLGEPHATPGGVSALAFDPSGTSLAASRMDGHVEIWDAETGERLARFATPSGTVNELVYSPDGSRIAIASEDGTVRLFDARTGIQQLVLRGHTFSVTGIAFSPDGTRLVSASPDGLVRVWVLDLDELIRIAKAEAQRELTDDECRQYLHVPTCEESS
jgi:WD40 repeat protein/class 3 adenylate cyclase